jgi:Domain of unknown function (DUF3854)
MTNPGGPFATDVPDLLQTHLDHLANGSGLPLDVIRDRGYRSVLGRKELMDLGFGRTAPLPGLLLPVWGPEGGNGLVVYRPDIPTVDGRGRAKKYLLPVNTSPRLDVPPRCRKDIGNPAVDLVITEGQKKADALATHGLCATALLGVWLFKGRNEYGGVALLADFDYIAWKNAITGQGRTVFVAFDSDVMQKPEVRQALARLIEHLQRKGAVVTPIYLPDGPDGAKVGVDDYLLRHSVDDLLALAQTPRPAVVAARPTIELLDAAPLTMRRPLALIRGQAYAAAWLHIQETIRESLDKRGEIVRHDPPNVTTRREVFVVRDDGTIYGPSANESIADVGFTVALSEPVRERHGWRAPSVTAYHQGNRPPPAGVFARVAAAYDHFLDFGHSLTDQATMCRLSACLSCATWFTPAFSVIGYAWPNGERGSGKSHWGNVWAATSYLGTVVLASGSFAALRDLADYGAALMFDDAEQLSDPRKADPDKRELMLAGNRRGTEIPLKEKRGDGAWVTRWVNAFAPRAFTAINLPDPVLASRSIVIPLVRTSDAQRGNADPAGVARWPCDQAQLQDDLWAMALHLLPEAERVWAELDNETSLIGREFEPWRATIAVARLLDRHGVTGLEADMRRVMAAYQAEKGDLLASDRTIAVVRAIVAYAESASDIKDVLDVSDIMDMTVTFTAQHIADAVKTLADDDDGDLEWATSRRVGRILSRLRINQNRDSTRTRSRERVMTVSDICALARAYGLPPMSIMSETSLMSIMSETSDADRVTGDHDPHSIPVAPVDDGDDVEVF